MNPDHRRFPRGFKKILIQVTMSVDPVCNL